MKRIYENKDFAETLKEKGWQYAQNFTQQRSAADVMKVYEKLRAKRKNPREKF